MWVTYTEEGGLCSIPSELKDQNVCPQKLTSVVLGPKDTEQPPSGKASESVSSACILAGELPWRGRGWVRGLGRAGKTD